MTEEKTEKQKMLSGEWYHAGYHELREDRKKCQELLKSFNNTPQGPERTSVARTLFGSYGERNFINYPFRCDYGYNIFFGDDLEMNYDCIFLDIGKIRIGNNVFMGPGVHIYAVNHPVDPTLRKTGVEIGQDVIIGDNVWIGGGAIILPGVTIGEGTTIGAGAVVTKDIPDNVMAAGNPCKVIKQVVPEKK
ncbi:trimeric LpxA-like protein [Choanephora cucurbitarum]|nr:trimeric LpxA-like protein [Choanephora cucurbitarum]